MNPSKERIEAIRKRLAESTPGPWENSWNFCDWNFSYSHSVMRGEADDLPIQVQSLGKVMCIGRESPQKEQSKKQCAADAELIAHAPEDLKFLIDRVERLEKALEMISSDVCVLIDGTSEVEDLKEMAREALEYSP